TAQQLHLNEILIVATNSTGGVMGKMIDAQSIMVACAACYDDPKERTHALGPIFRTVFFYSIAGAAVIGVIAMLQAFLFPRVIPVPPAGKGRFPVGPDGRSNSNRPGSSSTRGGAASG